MASFTRTAAVSTHGQRTLTRREYTDPAHFAEELERVFAAHWVCVGREEQVANPGDYVLVDVAGESLVLLRDRGGAVRAHFNVCRHRGTRLCEEPCGTLGETIQCPYHAWTYALDGRLVGVPDQKEFEGFDRGQFGLKAAAVATWGGFLFVHLGDRPEPFAEWFAPVMARSARWGLEGLRVARRIEYDVRANWKILFENYSECYHCSPAHPALARLSPSTSGENDLTDGPFLGGFMQVTRPGGSLTESGASCGLPVGDLPEAERQRVYYYSIFPNMLLSLHHDYVMVHTFRPQAPDRTLVTCEFLFQPGSREAGFDPDDGVRFWDRTNREDWHLCERTQQGVGSRAYRPGPYSRRESVSAAWDRHYRQVMAEG